MAQQNQGCLINCNQFDVFASTRDGHNEGLQQLCLNSGAVPQLGGEGTQLLHERRCFDTRRLWCGRRVGCRTRRGAAKRVEHGARLDWWGRALDGALVIARVISTCRQCCAAGCGAVGCRA